MTAEDSNPLARVNCDWMALRYVGDEMSPAERMQFEVLLAENQEAREAVAAAVLMFTAVPLALADSSDRQAAACEERVRLASRQSGTPQYWLRQNWLRRAGWATVGAAACLAGVLVIAALRNPSPPVNRAIATDPNVQDIAGSNPNIGDLALHWTDLAADADMPGTDANPEADFAEAGFDEVAHSEPTTTDKATSGAAAAGAVPSREPNEASNELAAPGWLLAALAPSAPGTPPVAVPRSHGSPTAE